MNDGETIERDLADLERYIKAGYLGALRSDGNSITDTTATVFGDYVMMRVQHLLKTRDTSRDQQTAKAYGGCTNCYGKGYATQSSRASGRGISWDTSGIKFCECPRGQQLKAETEQIALAAQGKGRIDEDKFWIDGLFNQDLSQSPFVTIEAFIRRKDELIATLNSKQEKEL